MTTQRRLSFSCPRCGGYAYGSSNCNSPSNMTRHCHMQGCRWQAHQSEDWKCFVLVEHHESGAVTTHPHFHTKAAYDAVDADIRAEMNAQPPLVVRRR